MYYSIKLFKKIKKGIYNYRPTVDVPLGPGRMGREAGGRQCPNHTRVNVSSWTCMLKGEGYMGMKR